MHPFVIEDFMKLDIPQEQFGSLVGAAVMQAITQENRDTLIQEAIQHLLSPSDNSYYGRKRSPLQAAFDHAVEQKAREFIGQTLDEMLAGKIKSIAEEALLKAFSDDRRDKLINNMADAIVQGFYR